MAARILLVEDDTGLAVTLRDRLEMHGYEVDSAGDGAAGLAKAAGGGHDLILLDVMLPKKNGFEVCRQLREVGVGTPILMLTARGQTADKVHGLNTGADDYLTKPFEALELMARIEALLRRAGGRRGSAPDTLRFGLAEVDLRKQLATMQGKPVNLSAREFQLLKYLAERRGETATREELLRNVWGMQFVPLTRTVDVHVTWLRQKLEENPKFPRHILTVRGVGYKFVE
jgi:two-component system alkaline phosphatase synthesis response regulator PhoP